MPDVKNNTHRPRVNDIYEGHMKSWWDETDEKLAEINRRIDFHAANNSTIREPDEIALTDLISAVDQRCEMIERALGGMTEEGTFNMADDLRKALEQVQSDLESMDKLPQGGQMAMVRQMKEDVSKAIKESDSPPPGEPDLMRELNIARTALRSALHSMEFNSSFKSQAEAIRHLAGMLRRQDERLEGSSGRKAFTTLNDGNYDDQYFAMDALKYGTVEKEE